METAFINEPKTNIGEALGELFRRSQRSFFRPAKTLQELFPDVLAVKGDMRQIPFELTCDSRKVERGSVFFIPAGAGERFIPEAIARGAIAIVSERPLPCDLPVATIQVPSLKHANADAARRFFGMPDKRLTLIAVAGSKGKTTLAYLMRHLLRRADIDCGMLTTIENDLGGRIIPSCKSTAEAIDLSGYFARMTEHGSSHSIVEISPQGIAQGRVIGLSFEIAVFTNLLTARGSEEEAYKLWAGFFKGELGPKPKRAIINLSDPYGQRLYGEIHENVETITYGTLPACDIRLEEIMGGRAGGEFGLRLGNRRYRGRLPMIGEKNITNAAGAIAAIYALGESVKDSVAALDEFQGVPGRLERISTGGPFETVVDYAHTVETLEHALSELRRLTRGRIITVFGCGGGHSQDKRRAITGRVMRMSDHAIATADNPRMEKLEDIFAMMKMGVVPGKTIEFIDDRKEAIVHALGMAKDGDCVLITGKGHESTQESGGRIMPFDDRVVAREILRQNFFKSVS